MTELILCSRDTRILHSIATEVTDIPWKITGEYVHYDGCVIGANAVIGANTLIDNSVCDFLITADTRDDIIVEFKKKLYMYAITHYAWTPRDAILQMNIEHGDIIPACAFGNLRDYDIYDYECGRC